MLIRQKLSKYIGPARHRNLVFGIVPRLHITTMICQRCLLRTRSFYSAPSQVISTKNSRASASILSTPRRRSSPKTLEIPPAAQSFSNSPGSLEPSPSALSSPEPAFVSSVPAGTPLRGLAYLKDKDPPLAQADHEYPGWLWGLLDEGKKSGKKDGADNQGDSYCKPHPTLEDVLQSLQGLQILSSNVPRFPRSPPSDSTLN